MVKKIVVLLDINPLQFLGVWLLKKSVQKAGICSISVFLLTI